MQEDEARKCAARLVRSDPATAFRDGLDLLKADYPELLLPQARRLSERHRNDPRLAQLHGLAARAVGHSAAALAAFARAARLAPQDALIAQSHAQAALETGQPAAALFERALVLAPTNGAALLGQAAAHVAEGQDSAAKEGLEQLLASNPLWLDGHAAHAKIARQRGEDPLASIAAALAANPAQAELHRLAIATLLGSGQPGEAFAAADAAKAQLGPQDWLASLAALAASEAGLLVEADRLLAHAPAPTTGIDLANRARHALRSARPEEARDLLEPHLQREDARLFWPYLGLAWRLLGDPRWQWLEGDPALVGIYDLAPLVPDFAALAAHLRGLHTASEQPLDQSVRGGTQTDGNLLLRAEPVIEQLRAAILQTVAHHVDNLPAPVPGHPTLLARRVPLRIPGSWSVRLEGAGFHTDHIHTHGWLSSALYITVPRAASPPDQAGWLSLGECRDVVPGLEPFRMIEPVPGRLVLFPSIMWHGTRPFPAGERLSVAFDIALPRQA